MNRADITSEIKSEKPKKTVRGRPTLINKYFEGIKRVFANHRNDTTYPFVHYKTLMEECSPPITSPTMFYKIARERLRESRDRSGHYTLAKSEVDPKEYFEKTLQRSKLRKWFTSFNPVKVDWFIPRPVKVPDSAIRAYREEGTQALYSDDKRYIPPLESDVYFRIGAVFYEVQPPTGLPLHEREKCLTEDITKIPVLMQKAGLPTFDFMYFIPEALTLACEEGKFDDRAPAKLSEKDLKALKETAFGKAKRIRITYAVDVDELFKWLKENKDNPELQRRVELTFKRKAELLKIGDQLTEEKIAGRRS